MNEDVMTENIETGTAIIKVEADLGAIPVLPDKEFADQLEALARDIQYFERQAVFRIANRLAKAHELFRYRRDEGGFQGWVENRLDYSRSHAYRLLDVNKLAKSFPSWDTFGTLSASAIYLLAAPSTPDEVRNEIADRVKAGEKISVIAVTEVIAKAKGKSSATNTPGAENNENTSNSDSGSAGAEISIETRRAQMEALAADEHAAGEHADEADRDDGGDDRRRDDGGDDRHAGGAEVGDALVTASPSASSKKNLLKIWDDATPEDQQLIRDFVLGEYFAQASGADIYDRIPADRLDEVIPAFLDKLTVEGMRTRMSDPFGQEARRKLAAPEKVKKSAKKWKRSINHHPANHAHQRDHRSRH
jgi:hypothetical protein